MSIQSEIERISGEVGDQTELIGQIRTALVGKGTGGAVVIGSLPVAEGNTPVAMNTTVNRRNGTSYGAIGGTSITIKKAGTYRFRWLMFRSSTSGTFGTQLYKGTQPQGSAKTTFSNHAGTCSQDITCVAGDVISIYGCSGASTNYIYAGFLTACINWDNGL